MVNKLSKIAHDHMRNDLRPFYYNNKTIYPVVYNLSKTDSIIEFSIDGELFKTKDLPDNVVDFINRTTEERSRNAKNKRERILQELTKHV